MESFLLPYIPKGPWRQTYHLLQKYLKAIVLKARLITRHEKAAMSLIEFMSAREPFPSSLFQIGLLLWSQF